MKTVLVRVDDRLIHGQVALGWTRAVGANHIMVVDNATASDPMQHTLLKMAAPSGVKVSILTTEEAREALLGSSTLGNDKVMILVRSPEALLDLNTAGFELSKVNVGNVRAAEGKTRITKEVHASPEELRIWKQLVERGVTLEAQWLPDQQKTILDNRLG